MEPSYWQGVLDRLASAYISDENRAKFYDRVALECEKRAKILRKIVLERGTDSPPKRKQPTLPKETK